MWPFKPKYKSNEPEKRKEALKSLNPKKQNHKVIIENLAKHDNIFEIRKEAYKILGLESSQAAISDCAMNSSSSYDREIAVKKLTDVNLIEEILKTDKDFSVRHAARIKLKKQNLKDAIIDSARHNPSYKGRIEALKKLKDMQIIYQVAINDEDWSVRSEATKMLADENQLIEIARSDKKEWVRISALKKIQDINSIAFIAKNDKIVDVREAAIKMIDDQLILEEIADNELFAKLQLLLSSKLKNNSCKVKGLLKVFANAEVYTQIEIAKSLKELFHTGELSQEDKAKILSLKGKLIKDHSDFSGNSCYPGHDDEPSVYFEL